METAPNFYQGLAQWSEIIGGFAFIVVAVLLFNKYVMPAVRSGQIAGNADLVNAESRREALKGEVGKARAEVEAADRDAQSIKERARRDAERERDRLIAEAKADGELAVATAQGELGRARHAAHKQLRAEFITQALALARARAGSRIDAGKNAQLVNATVQTLLSDGAGSTN